jgi:hypothetical protein
MRRALVGVGLSLWLGIGPLWAAETLDPLARARLYYNQGNFEAAAAAADEVRRAPMLADAADLIAGRADLERYRQPGAPPESLARARERFRRIDPRRFTNGERLEFVVGLGEILYFDEFWGASAAVFESLLAGRNDLPAEAREHVLDWWATALDRSARRRPDIERQEVYRRIRDRMASEFAMNSGNNAASYWASAAARGQGDLLAAWDAAQAGWVRASMASDRGEKLRSDLQRLVEVGIVPESARLLSIAPETLMADWERFKEAWTTR